MNVQEANLDEPALPALESLDDYIRRYGLLHAEDDDDDRNGEFNGLTRREAESQIHAEQKYLDSVIGKHFDDPCEVDEAQFLNHASSIYYQQSDDYDEAFILVLLSNDSTRTAMVKPLVSLCETVKRAVLSRSRFGLAKSNDNCQNSGENINEMNTANPIMQLSLVEFDSSAAVQFLDAVGTLFQHVCCEHSQQLSDNTLSDKISRKRSIRGTSSSQTQHVIHLIENGKISEQHIVECLRIAHYLQCSMLLDVLSSVLEASIDSKNCMSICSLADLYNLQSLFEASVNHVVGRLDALQGKSDNDETDNDEEVNEDERIQQEIWRSLPNELRSRILTMRNVMRSSVIGRGSKVSGVFFSSGDEFLAIFRETLCDQRERLAEARERRNEVICEREAEWEARRQRRGGWFDASEEARRAFIYSGDVEYALVKIQKQEQRIKTLEAFYEEQKIIFQNSSFGDSNIIL
ncbi:hypothetical protein HJC23_011570 [Cyclotella cryptica]|uniref:Uncharacterized protein n=1 Tax=Cyclotella cryptica TaxID=29204 RepID=A0ABD3QR70_9STRA